MNLVPNERLKLLATYLNGVAIAAIAIGGFSQIIAANSGTGRDDPLVIVGWIALSLTLHVIAQVVLGGMRE